MEWTNWIVFLSALITQVLTIVGAWFTAWKITHSKKRYVKDQISCKKREIWDIQKQITSIVCSGDKAMIMSEYTNQLAERLKQLKQEVADLNLQLKPKDQDHTKLNVTESIAVLNDTIKSLKGINNDKTSN